MLFPVTVINHATPAISVVNQDSGVPPVTYSQIRQSLGSQVYMVNGLYVYSTNINQLMGAIQYQIFDAGGNQNYNSITTVIDPYAGNDTAILVDITKYETNFILNGNSSFAATILANTYVQVKFFTSRITNTFGNNLENFKQIEIDANKPNFFDNYGDDISSIQATNNDILESVGVSKAPKLKPTNPFETVDTEDKIIYIENSEGEALTLKEAVRRKMYKSADGSGSKVSLQADTSTSVIPPVLFLSLTALGIGYLIFKSKK